MTTPSTSTADRPARRGGVVLLDDDGSAVWSIVTAPSDGQAPPVADDDRVYVGDDDGVAALNKASGRLVWRVEAPLPLYGLWLDSGLLIALGRQVGEGGAVLGLDTATGATRWRASLPGGGLLGEQALTGDGGLAWSLDHADLRTQVLDLRHGAVRWTSEAAGQEGSPAVGGGLVLRGEGRRVVAYDTVTGRVRWCSAELSEYLRVQVVGAVAVVDQTAAGPALDGAVHALRLSDGTAAWSLRDADALSVAGIGPSGVAVHTVGAFEPRFGLVDVRSGEVLWWATTQIALHVPPVVSASAVLTLEGGTVVQREVGVVARSSGDGRVVWRAATPDSPQPPVLLAPGRLLVLGHSGGDAAVSVAVVRDAATGAVIGQTTVVGWVGRPGNGRVLQSSDPHLIDW